MSKMTWESEKPLVWLHGEVKTPSIGTRCHELRIVDRDQSYRILYRLESDAVLILDVFSKKTRATPKEVIESCQRRKKLYERAARARR